MKSRAILGESEVSGRIYWQKKLQTPWVVKSETSIIIQGLAVNRRNCTRILMVKKALFSTQ